MTISPKLGQKYEPCKILLSRCSLESFCLYRDLCQSQPAPGNHTRSSHVQRRHRTTRKRWSTQKLTWVLHVQVSDYTSELSLAFLGLESGAVQNTDSAPSCSTMCSVLNPQEGTTLVRIQLQSSQSNQAVGDAYKTDRLWKNLCACVQVLH